MRNPSWLGELLEIADATSDAVTEDRLRELLHSIGMDAKVHESERRFRAALASLTGQRAKTGAAWPTSRDAAIQAWEDADTLLEEEAK